MARCCSRTSLSIIMCLVYSKDTLLVILYLLGLHWVEAADSRKRYKYKERGQNQSQ